MSSERSRSEVRLDRRPLGKSPASSSSGLRYLQARWSELRHRLLCNGSGLPGNGPRIDTKICTEWHTDTQTHTHTHLPSVYLARRPIDCITNKEQTPFSTYPKSTGNDAPGQLDQTVNCPSTQTSLFPATSSSCFRQILRSQLSVLGLPRGLPPDPEKPVECPGSSPRPPTGRTCPELGGILTRCPSHLIWLLSMQRSSGSTLEFLPD
ncbi:uncharacterized protein LOC129185284 [Dunckerocampus dactyliophorus]|uniref:uncharacterized protein LOC129185284 n=1 Tax=Dunckerocampus dactyliophorus TaxID=161453 RepID=UPI002404F1FD|nr:uncharacterized protein LOC129185284 [Dunckerocampus dactyliophorus]